MQIKSVKHQFNFLLKLSLVVILNLSFVYVARAKITKKEVLQEQKNWGDGLVAIGKTYLAGGNYKKVANELINNLYAYQTGDVLFKPTKASDDKFRMTKEGALSYFVGDNKEFPEDKGFALEPWEKVQFNNVGIYINGDVAISMGKYSFTSKKGQVVKVEYTFGYEKYKDAKIRIFLHHSSLPYGEK